MQQGREDREKAKVDWHPDGSDEPITHEAAVPERFHQIDHISVRTCPACPTPFHAQGTRRNMRRERMSRGSRQPLVYGSRVANLESAGFAPITTAGSESTPQ